MIRPVQIAGLPASQEKSERVAQSGVESGRGQNSTLSSTVTVLATCIHQ
ncbi:hypothetical protein [Profundibacter sp.]